MKRSWLTARIIGLALVLSPIAGHAAELKVLAGGAMTASLKELGPKFESATGPTIDIARVGFGVAIKTGAPKPDIGTPDKLKQALRKAQSIATLPESAAGALTS